jgi:hypothetical protein
MEERKALLNTRSPLCDAAIEAAVLFGATEAALSSYC